jgi:hypothetical protein
MLMNPIFKEWSDFTADDESNLLDDFTNALVALKDYYDERETIVTANGVALLQCTRSEYLFLVDSIIETFEIIKVSEMDGKFNAQKVSEIKKLPLD